MKRMEVVNVAWMEEVPVIDKSEKVTSTVRKFDKTSDESVPLLKSLVWWISRAA